MLCGGIERHMSTKRITTDQVGAELVEAARNATEDSLPLSTKLFPFIFIASRRMSLRAISRWLQEKHGVSLSAAAISRALANPELHLERLAESIAAPARYVATLYGFTPMDFLFGDERDNCPTDFEILSGQQPAGERDIDRWSEMKDLASVWLPIPHEVQLLLKPFLSEEFHEEGMDES